VLEVVCSGYLLMLLLLEYNCWLAVGVVFVCKCVGCCNCYNRTSVLVAVVIMATWCFCCYCFNINVVLVGNCCCCFKRCLVNNIAYMLVAVAVGSCFKITAG